MAPALRCFVHFDAQMCLAPQPRAIFQHLNFKNGSGNVVFCTFWLSNVLFATAACHFSPVRRTATSAPAALASLLFEHQEPRFIEKTQRFATSLTFFAHVELLASDSTRMLIFLLVTWLMLIFLLVTWLMLIFLLVTWLLCDSAFQLYILSEVRLLNFLRLNAGFLQGMITPKFMWYHIHIWCRAKQNLGYLHSITGMNKPPPQKDKGTMHTLKHGYTFLWKWLHNATIRDLIINQPPMPAKTTSTSTTTTSTSTTTTTTSTVSRGVCGWFGRGGRGVLL